ncbi:MAG: hypothetical protein R3F43_04180 [bacterium]
MRDALGDADFVHFATHGIRPAPDARSTWSSSPTAASTAGCMPTSWPHAPPPRGSSSSRCATPLAARAARGTRSRGWSIAPS